MSDKLRGDEVRSISTVCNKEGSKCSKCSLKNILRSPTSKESDTGGARNGCHHGIVCGLTSGSVGEPFHRRYRQDTGDAGRTCSHKHFFSCCANPGTTVCVGGE